MSDTLDRLAEVLAQRKQAPGSTSYVASLYEQGTDAILRKIVEEATEVVLAAKDGDASQIVHETADLWFHCLVLLAHVDRSPGDVLNELERRFGRSGIAEKASRD